MEYIWSVIALQNCLETCFLLIRFLSEKTDMLFYYFTMTVSLIVILKEWERTRVLEPLGSVYLRECVCVCVCTRIMYVYVWKSYFGGSHDGLFPPFSFLSYFFLFIEHEWNKRYKLFFEVAF